MPDYVKLKAQGLEWVAAPWFAQFLRNDERVAAPAGDVVLVKERPARRVWRFDAGGKSVFVKENLLASFRDRAKYAILPSKAWKEWRILVRLRRRGVPVPEPVAVGSRRSVSGLERSILITRDIGEVIPLEHFILDRICAASHAEAAGFTRAFASFVRRVHDAGVLQHDLHGRNIMVGGPAASPEFHLVDLYGVKVRENLTVGQRIANLAVLGHFFCQIVPRHWRLRFLERYFGGRRQCRDHARLVEALAERGMRSVWRGRDSRALGDNRYFTRERSGGLVGYRRRGQAGLEAWRILKRGDPFDGSITQIKSSRSSSVGMITPGDTEVGRLLVKRCGARRGLRGILGVLRRSRGVRGFYLGAAFARRGVPTPEVLAACDRRRLGMPEASYLVTRFVEDAENLALVAAGACSGETGRLFRDGKRDLSRRLAFALRRMHWSGLSMRDLKAANILVFARNGLLDFAIVDLDGARLRGRRIGERRAARDLARLYFDMRWLGGVSRREAMDFLKSYLGPCGRERTATWVARISRFVRDKRRVFRPDGVFAEKLGESHAT